MNATERSLPERVMEWMQRPMAPASRPRAAKRPRSLNRASQETAVIAEGELSTAGTGTSISVGTKMITAVTSRAYEAFGRWHPESLAELLERTRRHRCPHCGSHHFRRSRPRSVEWLLCAARIIPYRCYFCNSRFFGLILASTILEEKTSTPAY